MDPKDVKHGMHVTVRGESGTWEVLERTKGVGQWWLHRWEDGQWFTTSAPAYAMTLVSAGARQETLSMELETV